MWKTEESGEREDFGEETVCDRSKLSQSGGGGGGGGLMVWEQLLQRAVGKGPIEGCFFFATLC